MENMIQGERHFNKLHQSNIPSYSYKQNKANHLYNSQNQIDRIKHIALINLNPILNYFS